MISKPDICFYHFPCLDGFAAALGVWMKWGDDVCYVPINYDQPVNFHGYTGTQLLFADFFPGAEVCRALASAGYRITVLDHHKTAQAAAEALLAEGVIDGLFDMERSGAGIVWDDELVFVAVEVRRQKIDLTASATGITAQSRLKRRLQMLSCVQNVQEGKLRDSNDRKQFEMSVEHDCLFKPLEEDA